MSSYDWDEDDDTAGSDFVSGLFILIIVICAVASVMHVRGIL